MAAKKSAKTRQRPLTNRETTKQVSALIKRLYKREINAEVLFLALRYIMIESGLELETHLLSHLHNMCAEKVNDDGNAYQLELLSLAGDASKELMRLNGIEPSVFAAVSSQPDKSTLN